MKKLIDFFKQLFGKKRYIDAQKIKQLRKTGIEPVY